MLRPIETPTIKRPIDLVGLSLLVFWIGCLQIMLDIGRDHDWFGDPKIVALAIMAVIGFLVFIIWELTEEHPIVDLRVFRHSGFASAVLTLTLCFGAYFASIVIIPQWMQLSLGYTATWAGLATAFTAMAALTTAPLSARLITRIDPRIMISGSVAWLGCMALARSQWTSGSDFWTLSLPQLLQGFGMSFFMIPLTTVSLSAVPSSEIANAAGLQNFLRTMATAIATSIVLTVWDDSQRVAHNELVSKLQPDDSLNQLSNAGFSMEQSRLLIANLVDQEALAVAVNHTFLLTACILFFAAAIIWLSPRPKGPVDTSAAH